MAERILVIRLGALGDFALSFGPFAAIRAHHARAAITLLTTAPFVELAQASGWFDRVVVDARPGWTDVAGLLALRRQLAGFDMVYDLQTSGRSTRYWWLAGRPAWSGIGWARSHPHRNPGRDRLHTWERQRGQLADAGIAAAPAVDARHLARPAVVRRPYAVLVPGASAHRPDKRWPAAGFAALCGVLAGRGMRVVVAGGAADRAVAAAMRDAGGAFQDLTGQTDLRQLAGLMAGAAVAIGNDTGPMHLAAAMGCACVVLFGGASDPAITAPRLPDGGWATVLRVADLRGLPVDRVAAAIP